MSGQTKELHKETCPHCDQEIEVPYGHSIPCPKCEKGINVFDPEERKLSYEVFRGSRVRSLNDDRPSSSGSSFHKGQPGSALTRSGVSYKDIGGLDEVIEKLDILVNGQWKYPDLWRKLGGQNPRGILLTGPPGCGKTLLIQAIATESGRKMRLIQGAEVKGWRMGDTEGNLISAYKSVQPNGILVLDELDAIGGKRDQMINATEVSIVSTLCSILDGAKDKDNVIVIGTTNRPYALDSALRRPGRFDIEIEILPPKVEGRKEIFRIHTKTMPLLPDVDTEVLARESHGFTGADIAGACKTLSQQVLEDCARKLKEGMREDEVARLAAISQQDFVKVIRDTTPSILRGFSQEISTARWEDIGGLPDIKKELERIIIWPLKYRALMETLKMRLPKGMLLWGPPGCGKTLLARAIAGEIDYNFLAVNGPSLLSKWVGDPESAIRELFWRARMARPCIIFIDELESLASVRGANSDSGVTDRVVSQLLVEMDGVLAIKDVFVIGATNRKDMVDPALLRPGRFDLQYEISFPDNFARRHIFEIHLRGVPVGELDFDSLAEITGGKSGADIEWICVISKKYAAERCIESEEREEPRVFQEDLLNAIQDVNKRA